MGDDAPDDVDKYHAEHLAEPGYAVGYAMVKASQVVGPVVRAAMEAARADERAKVEAEFGGETLDIALNLARAGERARIVAALREYGDEHLRINREAQIIADMIERGEIGGA